MKKLFLSLALAVMTAVGVQAQLLYEISGNGLSKPSYIIGTYHLAPVEFADSVPGLSDAQTAVEQVYGELDMTELTSPENMQKMQQGMMLPDGVTLTSLLTADELKRLNAAMTELMGVDMTNPMVAQQLDHVTPMTLQTQLTVMVFLKKHSGFNPQATFDGYFQQVAQQQGKHVGGLESVEFQVQTLFQGTPLDRQKQLLMCFVDHRDYESEMAERLLKAYFSQDMDAIKAVLDEKQGDACDATAEEDNALIYNRNATWALLMPSIMKSKATFFAVGAAHLPGDRGVLQLLRNAGYTVKGVK